MLWSFHALAHGVFPLVGPRKLSHGGHVMQRLKGRRELEPIGCRGLLMQCRGDWAWQKWIFDWPAWNAGRICWRCLADNHTLNWRDCSAEAAWRATKMDHQDYMAVACVANAKLSPLIGFPGFKMEYIVIDVLHCCDLGITQDAIGNALAEWLREIKKATRCNKPSAISLLNDRLKQYRKIFRPATAINRITAEMIQQKGKEPKLKAKGAETRHHVRFAVELCLEMLGLGDDARSQVRYRFLSALDEFYHAMCASPFDPVEARRAAQEHVACYINLGWTLKPKHHVFLHLGEDQALEIGNPRDFLVLHG